MDLNSRFGSLRDGPIAFLRSASLSESGRESDHAADGPIGWPFLSIRPVMASQVLRFDIPSTGPDDQRAGLISDFGGLREQ